MAKRMATRTAITATSMLLLVAAGCTTQPVDATAESITLDPVAIGIAAPPPAYGGNFTVHALGKMCLDFGGQAWWAPGVPVTLYWCNGTIAQQFNVQEVAGAGHDVTLHVGNGTDNNYCIGARGGQAVAGAVLEMQVCDGSGAQQFALDGDSIIAGNRGVLRSPFVSSIRLPPAPIARQLVVKPLNDVTNAKTPMVLGPRQLTENEYLRFVATDGSNRKPHSGFVTPADSVALRDALYDATWGTVIDLADVTYSMDFTLDAKVLANGVTLRGDRKFTNYGPLIEDATNEHGKLLEIGKAATATTPTQYVSDVRVTGIHFQGATWGTDKEVALSAIVVHDDGRSTVIIDHNELSEFTSNGVQVDGAIDAAACGAALPAQPRPMPVRVSGNFIHHIIGDGQGYGVVVGSGAFPLIERNTEYQNRHSVAGSHDDFTSGYFATDNYILHQAPIYPTEDHVSNFDFHGSEDMFCHDHWGGMAGDYVVIQYNTFLTNDRENVLIRGESCRQGLVDGNIFGQQKDYSQLVYPNPFGCSPHLLITGGAVVNIGPNGEGMDPPPHLTITDNNLYSQPAPVDELAVGDFDGDGIDDLFTTTGNGWWYSSGGVAEWRWLRRATDKVDSLRVGDLDGDGRADVIRANGRVIEVSWGGISGWQTLTTAPGILPITSYAIGNFDGDRLHGDDIFASNGATWWVAKNGHNFVPTQTSTVPAAQLRFGDFDGDGKTDVFTTGGGAWKYSSAAASTWQTLPGAPGVSDVTGLIVGDFDADGRTDIGRYYATGWSPTGTPIWKFDYSPAARAAFTGSRTTATAAAWSGHFAYGTGVVWWDEDDFELGTGSAPVVELSRQKMK